MVNRQQGHHQAGHGHAGDFRGLPDPVGQQVTDHFEFDSFVFCIKGGEIRFTKFLVNREFQGGQLGAGFDQFLDDRIQIFPGAAVVAAGGILGGDQIVFGDGECIEFLVGHNKLCLRTLEEIHSVPSERAA